MGRSNERADLAALTRRWRQWTAVVELFARRRRARRRVNPAAYERLHRELLASCRSLAATANGSRGPLCRNLEALVGPWLTPEALERADGELRVDLLKRCRQSEREFGGRAWVWPRAAPPVLLLTLTAVLGASAVAVRWLVLPSWPWIEDGLRQVWFAFRTANDVERALTVGVLLTVIAMLLIWRAARS
jgi:hypothetical protein